MFPDPPGRETPCLPHLRRRQPIATDTRARCDREVWGDGRRFSGGDGFGVGGGSSRARTSIIYSCAQTAGCETFFSCARGWRTDVPDLRQHRLSIKGDLMILRRMVAHVINRALARFLSGADKTNVIWLGGRVPFLSNSAQPPCDWFADS